MPQKHHYLDRIAPNRTNDDPTKYLAISLFAAADAVKNYIGDHLLEAGDITMQQFNVLRILKGAGEEGLPTGTIAQRMIERTPGMTRMLDRLEKKGLTGRRRSTVDRRVHYAFITETGLQLLHELNATVEQADQKANSSLSAIEQETLLQLLGKLIPPAE